MKEREAANGVARDVRFIRRRYDLPVHLTVHWAKLFAHPPEIVEAIMAGGLKAGVDGSELMRAGTIDPDWERQAEQLLAG